MNQTESQQQGTDLRLMLAQADALCMERRFEEAATIYQQLVGVTEGRLGPNHPDCILVVQRLADSLYAMNAFRECLPLYERLCQVARSMLGDSDPDVINLMFKIARTQELIGSFVEARSTYEFAIATASKNLPLGHSLTSQLKGRYEVLLERIEENKRAAQAWKENTVSNPIVTIPATPAAPPVPQAPLVQAVPAGMARPMLPPHMMPAATAVDNVTPQQWEDSNQPSPFEMRPGAPNAPSAPSAPSAQAMMPPQQGIPSQQGIPFGAGAGDQQQQPPPINPYGQPEPQRNPNDRDPFERNQSGPPPGTPFNPGQQAPSTGNPFDNAPPYSQNQPPPPNSFNPAPNSGNPFESSQQAHPPGSPFAAGQQSHPPGSPFGSDQQPLPPGNPSFDSGQPAYPPGGGQPSSGYVEQQPQPWAAPPQQMPSSGPPAAYQSTSPSTSPLASITRARDQQSGAQPQPQPPPQMPPAAAAPNPWTGVVSPQMPPQQSQPPPPQSSGNASNDWKPPAAQQIDPWSSGAHQAPKANEPWSNPQIASTVGAIGAQLMNEINREEKPPTQQFGGPAQGMPQPGNGNPGGYGQSPGMDIQRFPPTGQNMGDFRSFESPQGEPKPFTGKVQEGFPPLPSAGGPGFSQPGEFRGSSVGGLQSNANAGQHPMGGNPFPVNDPFAESGRKSNPDPYLDHLAAKVADLKAQALGQDVEPPPNLPSAFKPMDDDKGWHEGVSLPIADRSQSQEMHRKKSQPVMFDEDSEYGDLDEDDSEQEYEPRSAPNRKVRSARAAVSKNEDLVSNVRAFKEYLIPVVVLLIVTIGGYFFISTTTARVPLASTQEVIPSNQQVTGNVEVFASPDASLKLAVGTTNCTYVDGDTALLLPYVIYDGSWSTAAMQAVDSLMEKQIWFNQAPEGMVTDSGTVLFDKGAPDCLVVKYMARIAQAGSSFAQAGQGYPKKTSEIQSQAFYYPNPFTGQSGVVKMQIIPESRNNRKEIFEMLVNGSLIFGEEKFSRGEVRCYAISDVATGVEKGVGFFVRGADRNGNFFHIRDGGQVVTLGSMEGKDLSNCKVQMDLPAVKAPSTKAANAKPNAKANAKAQNGKTANAKTPIAKAPAAPVVNQNPLAVKPITPDKPTKVWIAKNQTLPIFVIYHSLPIVLAVVAFLLFWRSLMVPPGGDADSATNKGFRMFAMISIGLCLITALVQYSLWM